MKKRLISIVLTAVICIIMSVPGIARAAENSQENAALDAWAIPDLIYGDSYGIYPLTWYEKELSGSVSISNMQVLFAGLRNKILATEAVVCARDAKPEVDEAMTVEEVIHAYGTLLSNYDYSRDIGFTGQEKSVEFMKQYGIYTGSNGEQGLKEICSVEQAMVIAIRIVTHIYDALDASSKGFLWQVHSEGNTVYMLGSIHVASHTIYPFSKAMLNAYQNADALVVEADVYNQQELLAYSQLAVYSDGTALKDHIPAELYQETIKVCEQFGLSEAMVAYMKPWYLYFVFENFAVAGEDETEKVDANLGIDISFINDAYIYQKPLLQIEGLYQQAKVIDGFSEGLQEYLLMEGINAVHRILDETQSSSTMDENDMANLMLQYWHDGDADAFGLINSGDELTGDDTLVPDDVKQYLTEYQDKLITQRDKGMAEYIDNLLKSEGSHTYFVVVGAGHFISDYSVLDILKEKGYAIDQIK